jgi:hypothetical protein
MTTSENIQQRFESGLQALKPSLFNLADQLARAYEQQQWGLLIGDDTSGRLVTRFARLALREVGVVIPARYIAASKTINNRKPYATFDAYAKYITGDAYPRALIVTESISRAANSMRFIHGVLKPYCQTLDMAILSGRSQPLSDLEEVGVVYYGAMEIRDIHIAVRQTFENPTNETDMDKMWSGPLTNLTANLDTSRGDAMRLPDAVYRSLAHLAYSKMGELAQEWSNIRS